MLLSGRKFSRLAVLGALCFIASMIRNKLFLQHFRRLRESCESHIYNNTLGFERIVVVSTGPSWRIEGLFEAAERTKLDVEVPQQPNWTTDEIDTFRGLTDEKGAKRVGPGQAKCWLGHLNALYHVIKNNWDSVLILEDDIDWDISIKQELALVAPSIRIVTNSTSHSADQPYGNAWDLLWVGHCGDAIPPNAISLFDDSLPETANYRENDGRYIVLTAKPQRRMVHVTKGPLCTYAYALTGNAAKKIYEYSKNGVENMITTDLRRWCQAGFLRCVTVNPELFHHHKQAGKVTSEVAVAEGWDDLSTPWKVNFTANIRYSARCNSKSAEIVTCSDELGDTESKAT